MNCLSPTTVHGEKTASPSRPARSNAVSSACVSGNDHKYPIKVSIVDDEENDRLLLVRIVQKSAEFACASLHASSAEALDLIPKVNPHLVLLDIRMPGMDGHECTRRLKVIMVRLKIIIVTGLLDIDTMTKSLQAGADGYLTKPIAEAQCLAMLKFTLRNGMPFTDKTDSQRFADILKTCSLLTVRENQVMMWLSKGLQSKEIPDHLGISFSAVHKHQLNSYRKLGAHNRTEALNKWRDNNHP